MEYYVARHPIFDRRMKVFGYKLFLCHNLRNYYYDLYREPDNAEELYRQLCFVGGDESPDKPLAFIEFTEEMLDSIVPLLPRKVVIVECNNSDNSEMTNIKIFNKIKSQEYGVAFDATENISQRLVELSDIVRIDFAALCADDQTQRIKSGQGKVRFLAVNIETWDDYKKAVSIGYDYFQGSFFLKPQQGKASDIRSFNANILHAISELAEPEPSFKELTNIIEHDLNLSYRLLKLVNSAYIAPKFEVKTISQAITILGFNELNKFMSTMFMKQTQSPGNTELLRRSLIRGKLLELLADHRDIPQKGSEAFFAGIFSLIDVILNRKMDDIMGELPLTDTVKQALSGEKNDLKELLDMIALYEGADWVSFTSVYSLDMVEQEELMNRYIEALKWAESLDF